MRFHAVVWSENMWADEEAASWVHDVPLVVYERAAAEGAGGREALTGFGRNPSDTVVDPKSFASSATGNKSGVTNYVSPMSNVTKECGSERSGTAPNNAKDERDIVRAMNRSTAEEPLDVFTSGEPTYG